MTHHCPRSNWTGPESELRRGICPKCAETTLYEDCEVRAIEAPAFPLGVSVRGPGSWMVGRTAQEIDEINAAAEAAGCTPEEVIVRRSMTTHAPPLTEDPIVPARGAKK